MVITVSSNYILFKNEAATISADTEIMLHNVAPFPPYNLTGISKKT